MKKNFPPIVASLFASIIVIFLVLIVEYIEKQRFQESLHVNTISQLSQIRAELEASINANFYLTRGLIAFVATHPDLDKDTFQRISSNLLRHRNFIRNIGLAPDNVLSFIHPIKGNEKALGLDYKANKKQWPAVKKVIDSHKTVVAGPVDLVQGGLAFISRTPIYIDSANADNDKKYWGLASIVIDQKQLFQAAGFSNPDLNIRIAIRGVDGLGKDGEIIDGEQKVFQEKPVVLDVHLPEGSWQLAATPQDGWEQASPFLKWIRGGGVFLVFLTGFGTFSWLYRMLQTQHKIEKARQNAEEATKKLLKNENFLTAIFEAIPNMVFVKDAHDLRFVRFNWAGEELTGYSKEELIGKSVYNLFPKQDADYFTEIDRKVLANGTLLDIPEESIQTRHKGNRILHTRKIPIFGTRGSVEYILGISEDITEKVQALEEKKAMVKQLHQAQRLESIGLMASGVAHDLNNLLAGIVGYPELLLQKLPKDSNLRKPIENIHESGKRAATVVDDLLTVARSAASTREVHNLNSLIQEYLQSLEFKKLESLYPKITWQHKLESIQPNILCSPVHIKKCLMNLVTNAAEAISENGVVVVSTHNRCIEEGAVTESNMVAGEYIELDVRDTGPGIQGSDLEHIFEPFYTKKEMGRSGTGLGLTVVWNTAQDHDGKVFVESNDKGTCFQIYLPVCKISKSKQTKIIEKEKIAGNGEHILVVDDESLLRDIACEMLDALGYVTDSVSSGELAIEYLKEKNVDLVVIDMMMEPGMNGRQTYEEIIKLFPAQKAIIASGFSESDDVKEALRIGIGGFIKKPYSMDQLGQAVKEALSK